MTKSLTKFLQEEQQAGRKAFVPYIMAGAQGLAALESEIRLLQQNGATLIELGVPFSDPVADGPVIQAAGAAARQAGTTLKKIIATLQALPQDLPPLVLMGYANSFFQYGYPKLVEDLQQTAVKGLIIPDLPLEHQDEFRPLLADSDLALIQLVTLTSPAERKKQLLAAAEGFVYAVTLNGTTGKGVTRTKKLLDYLAELQATSPVPVFAGFGIQTPEDVLRLTQVADGVVVGSTIVDSLAQAGAAATAQLLARMSAPLATDSV